MYTERENLKKREELKKYEKLKENKEFILFHVLLAIIKLLAKAEDQYESTKSNH